MNDILYLSGVMLLAYCVGAIPFGWLIGRWRGKDLFHEGSGNIGATNVGRVLGWRLGVLVFVLDFLKGALPTTLAAWLLPNLFGLAGLPAVAAGLAAVLGHMFPVYLGFHGGKGVATGTGVVLVLMPGPAVIAAIAWVGTVVAWRMVSLGSLAAATTLCLAHLVQCDAPFAPDRALLTGLALVVAALVWLRHRSNIQRIVQGTENRLPEKPWMMHVGRMVHVLAIGLWFGMAAFFTFVVGLSLFRSVDDLAHHRVPGSESWFAVPKAFDRQIGSVDGRYEYGTRIAGHAISPMFDWYFLLQGICGFLAFATAWPWFAADRSDRVHRLRISLLCLALLTVIAGWPLEQYVSELRVERHQQMDAVFLKGDESALPKAIEAKAAFGTWHTVSLFLNFGTLALVAVVTAMAAFPAPDQRPAPQPSIGGNQHG